ncbi:MAG: hypothetical protein HKN62_01635 [Phycisphaerales bacterium]|nr:hypothetical protein [Phycisphaerales bacterium]
MMNLSKRSWWFARGGLSIVSSFALTLGVSAQDCDDCPENVDGIGCVDAGDFLQVIFALGPCPEFCEEDLTGDGVVDHLDIARVMAAWDDCMPPTGVGEVDHDARAIDNTAGNGSSEFFAAGRTHFTFDLKAAAGGDANAWTTSSAVAELVDPRVSFFRHPVGTATPPLPDLFELFPALEFDGYWCRASLIPPGVSGSTELALLSSQEEATVAKAVWVTTDPTRDDVLPLSIWRFTIQSSEQLKDINIVPAGTGGGKTVLGTISGESTHRAGEERGAVPIPFDFDIIESELCREDIDGGGDIDFTDLLLLLTAWGPCPPDGGCPEDVNFDQVVGRRDLALVIAAWGDCLDAPLDGTITTSVRRIDNTAGNPDPSGFAAGTRHFTFDLQTTVNGADNGWTTSLGDAQLFDPRVSFYQYPALGEGLNPPDPIAFPTFPALEFDTYLCAATVIPPGGAGSDDVGIVAGAATTPQQIEAVWFEAAGPGQTPGVAHTIGRITLAASDPILMICVVPAGTGGAAPLLGRIAGDATHRADGALEFDFAFDIVERVCPADIICDGNVGFADLLAVLAAWGECTGSCIYCDADLDDSCDVGFADLLTVLAAWGPCVD